MYYHKYNQRVGSKGEKCAERYLRKKGYLFIARNYWGSSGEIDLVFWKNFSLIFVEVKTRSGKEFGTGREAVDASKRRNIINASREFIDGHCENKSVPFYLWKIPVRLKFKKIRFDVVEVTSNERFEKYEINAHLKGYFSY